MKPHSVVKPHSPHHMPLHRAVRLRVECEVDLILVRRAGLSEWAESYQRRLDSLDRIVAAAVRRAVGSEVVNGSSN